MIVLWNKWKYYKCKKNIDDYAEDFVEYKNQKFDYRNKVQNGDCINFPDDIKDEYIEKKIESLRQKNNFYL